MEIGRGMNAREGTRWMVSKGYRRARRESYWGVEATHLFCEVEHPLARPAHEDEPRIEVAMKERPAGVAR